VGEIWTSKGYDGKAEAERDWRRFEAMMQGSGKLLPNRMPVQSGAPAIWCYGRAEKATPIVQILLGGRVEVETEAQLSAVEEDVSAPNA
jgi:hypothetical protein